MEGWRDGKGVMEGWRDGKGVVMEGLGMKEAVEEEEEEEKEVK